MGSKRPVTNCPRSTGTGFRHTGIRSDWNPNTAPRNQSLCACMPYSLSSSPLPPSPLRLLHLLSKHTKVGDFRPLHSPQKPPTHADRLAQLNPSQKPLHHNHCRPIRRTPLSSIHFHFSMIGQRRLDSNPKRYRFKPDIPAVLCPPSPRRAQPHRANAAATPTHTLQPTRDA